jgi:hypothetical protein
VAAHRHHALSDIDYHHRTASFSIVIGEEDARGKVSVP